MKRAFALLLAFVMLSACSFTVSTDEGVAKEYIDRLFTALKTEDKALLKSLFSENAQAESAGLNENVDAIMDIFGGRDLSYSNDLLVASSHSNDHGDVSITIDFHLNIECEGVEKYCMYFYGCRQDDSHKANEGLTSLCVYLEKDEYTFGYNDQHQKPGIEIFKGDDGEITE